MAAPIVNSSSIPLTGNAAVTQGCGQGLVQPTGQATATAAAPSAQPAAGSANPSSRPGFFLLAGLAQGPPAADPSAKVDADTAGTALPTSGNFLPLLLLSAWRAQSDPATLPAAVAAGSMSSSTVSSVAAGTVPSAASDATAAARAETVDPALRAARTLLELMRAPTTNGGEPLAPAVKSGAPAAAATGGATPTAAAPTITLPANIAAQAAPVVSAPPPPEILAALVKRLAHDEPPADATQPQAHATTSLPLDAAADSAVTAAAGSTATAAAPAAVDIKQFLDNLPKHATVDQLAAAPSDGPPAPAINGTPSAPLFVDGHALRGHAIAAQAADGAAQNLRLDVPMRSPEWAQALGDRITWLVDQNLSSAQIRLNPPQLGPIEVRIALAGDSTQVSVSAHSLITRDALEAAAPRLRDALSAHGLGNVSVDISQQSFTDRPLPQSRADAWEPWQAVASDVTTAVTRGTMRLQSPGRLDAYA
jgi:flagellar hook-length control protein FliK